MKVMLIGQGGREHALAWKLSQSELLTRLYVAPGSDAIDLLDRVECVDIAAHAYEAIVSFACAQAIDLVVIGPEQPLADGLVNMLLDKDIKAFGPQKNGAQIEASKTFAKTIMQEVGIPTPKAKSFQSFETITPYLKEAAYPLVIKADGLAAGKGVMVCQDFEQACAFATELFQSETFGHAGRKALVETYLEGRECSILAITDGTHIKLLASAQDHKRLCDGALGPNTGGMGAYSPSPIFDEALKADVLSRVFQPLIKAFHQKNITYRGIIYAGLMITADGLFVLEFNARFGDPETQVILPRMKSDLLELILHASHGTLDQADIQWFDQAALTVVMASDGYPLSSDKNIKIHGLEARLDNGFVFHAGTKKINQAWFTNGGRVLAVSTWGQKLETLREKAYQNLSHISFEGAQHRKDIGLDIEC